MAETAVPADVLEAEEDILNPNPVILEKGWIQKDHWWQWLFPWINPTKVIVRAQEKIVDEGPFRRIGRLAAISIFFDDVEVLRDTTPWLLPFPGEEMLVLHVYLLSKMPDYKHKEFQEIMEHFCYMFPGFRPPDKLWWGKETMFD